MKTLLLSLALGGILIGAVVWVIRIWIELADVEMSGHGIVALVLGALLSLALGMGLMFLVFYSSRHGHDDGAGQGPG